MSRAQFRAVPRLGGSTAPVEVRSSLLVTLCNYVTVAPLSTGRPWAVCSAAVTDDELRLEKGLIQPNQ
jgi:hypothetical protein